MTVKNIINYLRVSDRISSSGQPDEDGFRSIAAAGFGAVINLAMPSSKNAISEEGSIVTELGMAYHHIPVPFDAPKASHLKQFFGLMESLQDEMVWVHCVVNYRGSAFLYLYRRWKGMPDDEARIAVLANWEPNATWRAFMAQPIDNL
ncbi:MAG: protein tyrosine phosphatase family protein [Xenococcaceae cyanobacterium]